MSGTAGLMWLLLLCTPLLAGSSEGAGTTTPRPEEEWTGNTVPLQPNLQTEAQTPTEPQTEVQKEAQTEVQTEAQTEVQKEAQTEVQTEAQTEVQKEAQTEVQTEAQTEVQTEAQTEAQTEVVTEMQTQSVTSNYTGLSCIPVLPPRRGSFYVEGGTGVSVGSVLAFWCREGYQLVGSDKIHCTVRGGKAQWSNYLPVCEAIPRPEDRGLRVAVLASVVSGIVILAMSLSFLICCLQERSSRDRAKREGRSRRREKRSARRSECWLEREEGDWESFPPPKIFHLSQRMNPRLAPDSPLYLSGGLGGYENRGYQRSQESLLKASLPGLYRSESQLYPHVVLQRVPTPTAPSAPSAPLYLHLPSTSAASSPAHNQPHIMTQYPTPTYPPSAAAPAYPPSAAAPAYPPRAAAPAYPHPAPAPIYPNPNPTPQRPWQ